MNTIIQPRYCTKAQRVVLWSSKRSFGQHCGGAGMGNVKDQMIANTEEHLFRHTKRPKTVSIIG